MSTVPDTEMFGNEHVLSDATKDGRLLDGYRNHWTRMSMEGVELLRAAQWVEKHLKECDWKGDFTFAQSGSSGIGTNTVIRCCKCHKSCDVTEYGSW
jgi:hypothetical protein